MLPLHSEQNSEARTRRGLLPRATIRRAAHRQAARLAPLSPIPQVPSPSWMQSTTATVDSLPSSAGPSIRSPYTATASTTTSPYATHAPLPLATSIDPSPPFLDNNTHQAYDPLPNEPFWSQDTSQMMTHSTQTYPFEYRYGDVAPRASGTTRSFNSFEAQSPVASSVYSSSIYIPPPDPTSQVYPLPSPLDQRPTHPHRNVFQFPAAPTPNPDNHLVRPSYSRTQSLPSTYPHLSFNYPHTHQYPPPLPATHYAPPFQNETIHSSDLYAVGDSVLDVRYMSGAQGAGHEQVWLSNEHWSEEGTSQWAPMERRM